MTLVVAINNHISKLEAALAKEEAAIEAAIAPQNINGQQVFYSPGDGYWKRHWTLRNKLNAAYELRALVAAVVRGK